MDIGGSGLEETLTEDGVDNGFLGLTGDVPTEERVHRGVGRLETFDGSQHFTERKEA